MISMKRILCLALVLVLLFQIIVVPAQASAIGTGILITASAASVISAALIGLGVMPGSDGSVFDGIVSGAADYLSSLGFGDGVGFPVLKYFGTGGTVRYALETAVMTALRSWLFDEDVVSSGSSSITVSGIFQDDIRYSASYPFGVFTFTKRRNNGGYIFDSTIVVLYSFSSFPEFNVSSTKGQVLSLDDLTSDYRYYYGSYSYVGDTFSCPYYGFFDLSTQLADDVVSILNSLSGLPVSSSYDVTLGDVASPDTPLADAYPGWGFDSIQIDPDDGDDPIPYVPIGLDDRYDGITQEDVQSGESTLETPNEGTQVNISGDVGGSLTPDGGGSGDLPGGEGSVTVDDLTTMFAWLAVRIDEAVQSLFPDLQVIKTYLKSIAQWHETENVKYDSMLSYFSGWDADIDTMLTTVSNIDLNLTTLVDHAGSSVDLLAAIAADVQDIRDVIADPLDADINEQEQDNKNAFLNTFSKKSQAKNITDLSGFSDGFSDWFDLPDVSIGAFFDQLETGVNPWFTSQTQQAISVGGGPISSGAALMSDDPPATPYLDAWDLEVQSILNGGHDDG